MTQIFVDADACPVKEEILKVVARYQTPVTFVANQGFRLPQSPLIKMVVVEQGPDVADNWIAEAITDQDVCITGDIELAARCLKKKAHVLNHSGKPFDDDNIGMSQTMRDLNAQLRDSGDISGRHKALSPHDRQRFASALNNLVAKISS